MKTKQCSKCGKSKPLQEFYRNNRLSDGYCGVCKECQREQRRKRYKHVENKARRNLPDSCVYKKPIWIRNKNGEVLYFDTTNGAVEFLKTTKSVLYKKIGKTFKGWQITRTENDFSECPDFDFVDEVVQIVNTQGKRLEEINHEIDKMKREMYSKLDEEPEPIKEPKNKDDFDEMRKRALQPFQGLLTEEYIKMNNERRTLESAMRSKKIAQDDRKTKRDYGGLEECALNL